MISPGVEAALERQCELLASPAPGPGCARIKAQRGTNLKPWIAADSGPGRCWAPTITTLGLITGYYEPILTGSRVRENELQAPLYRRPNDLLRIEIPNSLDPGRRRPEQPHARAPGPGSGVALLQPC